MSGGTRAGNACRRALLPALAAYVRHAPDHPGRWRLARLAVSWVPLLKTSSRTRSVRLCDGIRLHVDGQSQTGRIAYATGRYEPDTTALIRSTVKPGDTVVDVGANIGYFSLVAAGAVGETGRVLAFEPVPAVRRQLIANLALNRIGNADVREEVLGPREDVVTFHCGPTGDTGLGSLRALQDGAHIRLRQARFDDVWRGTERVSLIKIDVEGGERGVLEGMTACLARDRPDIILEVTDSYLQQLESSAADLHSFLTSHRYRVYEIAEGGQLSLIPDATSLAARPSQFNAFCTQRAIHQTPDAIVAVSAEQRLPRPTRWRWRLWLEPACLLIMMVAAAEITARVDDRVRNGVPMLSSPDRDADLVLRDELGLRGRPNGRYKTWKLNAFGFRGPEITQTPAPGCIRVMTLGSSETFGLYEAAGREYPAQLAQILRSRGCYEVVNASLYGLTLPAIRQNWANWASRFAPHIVTVYPTPSFYLASGAPATPSTTPTASTRPPWWTPRILERARDVIEIPGFIQRRRVARAAAMTQAQHPRDWFFSVVPPDRLAQFEVDLDQLVQDVEKSGATVILLTHATGFAKPLRDGDRAPLAAWQQLLVKPTSEVLLDFEAATRRVTLDVAARRQVGAVDVAAALNGDRRAFAGDLLHFNEDGASRMAALIAADLMSRPGTAGRQPVSPDEALQRGLR